MSELSVENQKKHRLGRGLGSLLGETSIEALKENSQSLGKIQKSTSGSVEKIESIPNELRVWKVGIEKVIPSKYQPRTQIDQDKLEELASSIKEHGILQPITVSKRTGGGFEIIAGERRWRAAQIAGLHEVPVIIKEVVNKQHLELAIIENIQREDLNPIEECLAYHRLSDEFGLTQQQIAQKVGKDRVTVTNIMRLISLPEPLKDFVRNGQLSLGHAKILLSLENPENQLVFAEKCIKNEISVRGLEKILLQNKRENTIENPDCHSSNEKNEEQESQKTWTLFIEEELRRALGTKVQIMEAKGQGKIIMHYYSKEECTQIVDRIISGCQK